jgi:ABC-2 type transport system permease protein
VAPANAQASFEAGERSKILVRVNLTDPVQKSYAVFLARGLEAAVNGQVIQQAAKEAEGFVITHGGQEDALIPPDVVAAPAQAYIENVAPSDPTVVQYFAPAVLALILQHLAVSLIALSVVRERNSGLFELFRVSPISTFELVTGKLIAFGLFAGVIACSTIALVAIGFGVPILADPVWIATTAVLLIASSLGLGLLVSAVADSEPHAVQLSLLILLASVFFSGFVLAIAEFSEPVRALIYALPVASGIRLLGDFMFRGGTVVPWQLWMLAILAAIYISGAWVMLRRAMSRA